MLNFILALCNIYSTSLSVRVRRSFTFVALFGLLLCLFPAQGATFTWDGGGSNSNWSTSTNWSSNNGPNQASDGDLVFTGSTQTSAVADGGTWFVDSVSFNSGAGAFTLSGGTLFLDEGFKQYSSYAQTVTNDVIMDGSQTWNIGGGGLHLSGDLSSPYYMTLTKTGTGTLTLSANNSGFTGPVVVANGTLNVQSSTALGSSTGNTVQSGGALELQGGITLTEDNFTITGTGVGGSGALRNVSGDNTLNSVVTLGGNSLIRNESGTFTLSERVSMGTNTLTISGAGNTVFTGSVQGTGTIRLTSSGDTIFANEIQATNTYLNGTGTTTYSGNQNNNNAATYVNSGTLILAKNSGLLAISGDLTVGDGTGTDMVQFNSDNQTPNYKGITVNSSGALNLNGHHNEITTLTLSGGTVTNTSSGLLTINSANAIIAANNASTATINSNVLFSGWNSTINVANGASAVDLAITGTITASHGVIKSGPGTLQLSGTYVNGDGAALKITGGTLMLGSDNVFASGTAANGVKTGITLQSGTTFASNGHSDTMGALTLSGNSTINLGNGSSSLTFDSVSYTSGTLTISNWTDGSDHIYLSSTPSNSFLSHVYWADTGTTGAIMFGNELRPNAPTVPEPDTALAALLFIASVGCAQHKRLRKLLERKKEKVFSD